MSPKRRRLGLYFRMHPKNISQEEVHDFLWYLIRHPRGQVIALWNDTSIHDPNSVRELLRRYLRLNLQRLPAYAPNLHPSEAARHATKHPLATGRPEDIHDLAGALLENLRQARASQAVLRGRASQSALPLFLR